MTDEVLHETDIDHLGQALITLTKELWIVKDRQRVLEATLVDAGLLKNVAVDTYQPDAALQAELQTARQNLIDGVIDALTVEPSHDQKSSGADRQ
jgi:hypothetical protein